MMQSLSLSRAPAGRVALALAPRRVRLVVAPAASTLWSLAPKGAEQGRAHTIDLTQAIGARRVCSVGARDYAASATDSVDYTVIDHGGVHVLFEAEGTSNPLDSPSVLFITDVDSASEVRVDGQPLPKKERRRVKPGACVCFGENAEYRVLRNVFAHA